MASDVVIVYAGDQPPGEWDASLFLAGQAPPTDWDGPGTLVVFAASGVDLAWERFWGDRTDFVVSPAPADRWVASGRVVTSVDGALSLIGEGAHRVGGERHVPLVLWRTSSFQSWLTAVQKAGNELRSGRLEWAHFSRDLPFLWAFHANVYIALEDRVKDNEIVLSRPDIACVVAYRRAASVFDAEVVLVREFRSPGGFIRELPGGSSPTPMSPLELAVEELAEETGVRVPVDRFRAHHDRPLAASFSAHRQHVFSVELTALEIAQLRPAGNADDTERTYPEVHRFGELMASGLVDWTTLGALAEVLLGEVGTSASTADS